MSKEINERTVYVIPENYAEGTGMLGGMLKLRNTIEGVIMALPIAIPIFFSSNPLDKKIIYISLFAFPLFALGAVGINGDCVSEFLMYFFKFKKKRRQLKYNPRVKLEYSDIINKVVELPRDKMLKLIKSIKERNGKQEADTYFAVGKNIRFADDIELEKKIKGKESKKKKSKSKRGKK